MHHTGLYKQELPLQGVHILLGQDNIRCRMLADTLTARPGLHCFA